MDKINDFFITNNYFDCISEDEYDRLEILIDLLEATNRTTFNSTYVIDYYRKNFLFVSDNPLFLGGLPSQTVKELGYTYYLNSVSEKDLDMLIEINQAGFKFFNSYPVELRKKLSISYDFFIKNGKEQLINHKLTPIRLAQNGNIWLALCVVSLSSKKKSGNIEARIEGQTDRWTYSLEKHEWEKRDRVILSEREKKILFLSAQGYIMKEIAEHLLIGIDTIKNAKRILFKKIGVKNITEALTVSSSEKLI